MQIKEEIVNAGHGYLNPSLFAVHSTANPGATARNHRDLWSRGYDYAVHLTSDWTEAIHCVPYDRLCWQVGNGNGTCEGIEICEATNASDFWRGIDIAADVIAQRSARTGGASTACTRTNGSARPTADPTIRTPSRTSRASATTGEPSSNSSNRSYPATPEHRR